MMKEDRHEQSERFSEQNRRNYVIMIAELILTLCSFFQENKSYGIKNQLHCSSLHPPLYIHHVMNSYDGALPARVSSCYMTGLGGRGGFY